MAEKQAPGPQLTPEQAAAIVRQAQRERYERCRREIDAVLAKYGCNLVGQPYIAPDGRIAANVVLVEASG